jgi:putative transposase
MFFKKQTEFPKFKSKKDNKNKSYTTNNLNNSIRIEDNKLRLPKIGLVKIKMHRNIPDNYELKSVTIKQKPSGKYYASILFEYDIVVEPVVPQSFLGLDFAMGELYVDSDNNRHLYTKFYRLTEERLAKEQRILSKMKKGSNNYKKQKLKVALIHEHIANQRKDFLHKQSRQIANAFDCVCIEDLNMQGMSKALQFGKSVHDNGWGMFTNMLSYKLTELGKQLIKIDKYYPSSQLCSSCGYQNPAVKDLSIRQWTCLQCETTHIRDHNAAINIMNEGKRLVAV